MQQVAQGLRTGRIKTIIKNLVVGRAPLQHGQTLRVEGMDDVAHGLSAEADARRDHAHLLTLGAGQDDLGATEDKGIGRVQGRLQGLTLAIHQGTDEERMCCVHTFQYGRTSN